MATSIYDASRLGVTLTPTVMEVRTALGLPPAPYARILDRELSAEASEEAMRRLGTVPPDLLEHLGLDPDNMIPEPIKLD